jgi:hypothetical protein
LVQLRLLSHPKKGRKSQGTMAQAASHGFTWFGSPNLVKPLLSQAKLSQTEPWQRHYTIDDNRKPGIYVNRHKI